MDINLETLNNALILNIKRKYERCNNPMRVHTFVFINMLLFFYQPVGHSHVCHFVSHLIAKPSGRQHLDRPAA